MTTRHYSSTAQPTTLAAPCTDSATTIQVTATTGFPAVDFILALDYGTSDVELVLVTDVAGTTLTVTRGYDSTTAVAHLLGATVVHDHAAIDFRDSRTHEDATSGVHGTSGSMVGTTDSQALTNKDLSSGTNVFPPSLATDAEVTSAIATHSADTTAVHGIADTSALATKTGAETLTNKTIALGSNSVSGTKAQFNTAITDADMATLAGTETLTGKTLTSPTITDAVLTKGGKTQLPLIVCTSATRPSHVEGQTIYETDTDLIYSSNGSAWVARGGLGQIVTFTADGTFAKASYPGLRGVKVTVVAAGGSGGRANNTGPTISNASGAGSGGIDQGFLDASALSASEAVTVGTGATGNSAGGDGFDGENSSFGTHFSATGGGGGTAGLTALGIATPGVAGTGAFADGSKGQIGLAQSIGGSDVNFHMGDGGPSPLTGQTARLSHSTSSGGATGKYPGGGGSGGCRHTSGAAAMGGGDGADGVVIVELYF